MGGGGGGRGKKKKLRGGNKILTKKFLCKKNKIAKN
jgi:hypothetical protein